MITSAITYSYPTGPAIAPGTVFPAGPPGASAYQIAVGEGFAGSEADWLASLVGPGATQAQVAVAVSGLIGQPGGLARQDDLAAEVSRAEGAEGLLMPNTIAALQALITAWLRNLPVTPSAAGPTWWSNGGQPTYS